MELRRKGEEKKKKYKEPAPGLQSHAISILGYGTENPKIVMFGGTDEEGTPMPSTVYVFEINDLNAEKPEGTFDYTEFDDDKSPPWRVGHAQAIVNEKLYVFGGRTEPAAGDGAMNDMWVYDWQESAWSGPIQPKSEVVPEPRSDHQLITVGGLIYCFGGAGVVKSLLFNDLHAFDPATECWTSLPSCDQLAGRRGAAFAANGSGTSLYVIAGYIGDNQETKEMFRYDIETQIWTKLSDFPEEWPKRSYLNGTTVPNLDLIGIFGGELEMVACGTGGAENFTDELISLSTKINEEAVTKIELAPEAPEEEKKEDSDEEYYYDLIKKKEKAAYARGYFA